MLLTYQCIINNANNTNNNANNNNNANANANANKPKQPIIPTSKSFLKKAPNFIRSIMVME